MPVMPNGLLLGRLLLQFNQGAEDVPGDLSAAALGSDGSLWLASDERGFIDRVTPTGPHTYGNHERFALANHVDILTDPDEEIDLEAIECVGEELWFVGSHSAKRKRPKKRTTESNLDRLATVQHDPTRFLLGHLAMKDGRPAGAARRLPVSSDSGLQAESMLLDVLREDPHLAPFLAPAPDGRGLAIPGKDNGLDIEGLAVLGDRVLLGLRGPVLRGHALILEFGVEPHGDSLLVPKALSTGRRFRKHLMQLDGLGIRELCRKGDDLLLLAGPTMALSGPNRVYRLVGGLPDRTDEDTFTRQEPGRLERLFDIPFQEGCDHAEGMALHSWFDEHDSVLVVYDTPAPERRIGELSVLADVFRLR